MWVGMAGGRLGWRGVGWDDEVPALAVYCRACRLCTSHARIAARRGQNRNPRGMAVFCLEYADFILKENNRVYYDIAPSAVGGRGSYIGLHGLSKCYSGRASGHKLIS